MTGYVPGEQLNDPDIIKLNTNENPYPPCPRVFEAIRAALTGDRLRKYPHPLGDDFRKAAGRVLERRSRRHPDRQRLRRHPDDPDAGLRARGRADRLADAELHPLPLARRDSGGALRDGAFHRRLASCRSRGRFAART